jgi:hypothetical protein
MASKTKRTEMRRAHKKAAQGTKRKASLRTKGSTKSAKVLVCSNKIKEFKLNKKIRLFRSLIFFC